MLEKKLQKYCNCHLTTAFRIRLMEDNFPITGKLAKLKKRQNIFQSEPTFRSICRTGFKPVFNSFLKLLCNPMFLVLLSFPCHQAQTHNAIEIR